MDDPLRNGLPRVREIAGAEAENTEADKTDCKEEMTERDNADFVDSPFAGMNRLLFGAMSYVESAIPACVILRKEGSKGNIRFP